MCYHCRRKDPTPENLRIPIPAFPDPNSHVGVGSTRLRKMPIPVVISPLSYSHVFLLEDPDSLPLAATQ